jgi:hypothetical protein
MEHLVPFLDLNTFTSAAIPMFSNGAGSASHLDVRAVALPAFIDISTGTIPVASLAKSNSLPATPQPGSDKDTSPDFLALLLAGLGLEAEPQVPPETAPASGGPNPQRGAPKKSNVASAKEKPAGQSSDVIMLSPLPVVTTQTRMPRLMPQTALEFQKPAGSKLSESGSDAIVNGSEASRGAVLEKVPATAFPAATPEPAAPEPASSPEIASPSASTKAVPDSAGAAPRLQNEAEIAFEARIQLRAPDNQDQTGLPMSNEIAEKPEALQPAIGTSNSEPVPPPTTDTAHSEPVPQATRPASEQSQGHKDAGKPEPLKSPQNQTDEDSISDKLPPDNDTSDDSAGQEQPDSAVPKKPSTVPNEIPVDGTPLSQEAQSSVDPLPAPAPANGFQAAGPVKSEPPPGSTAPSADAASAPSPAGAPAKDIAIQLQDPGGPRVDVELSDRAGTVHVVVRTPDDGLARDLRANLPDLAQKLNQQGTDGEAWNPVEMRNMAGEQQNPRHAQEQSGGNSQFSSNGRDPGGRNREQEQRQDPDPEDEFEPSFSGVLTGVTTWQPIR